MYMFHIYASFPCVSVPCVSIPCANNPYVIAKLSFNFNYNLVESWDGYILNFPSDPATHPPTGEVWNDLWNDTYN